MDIDHNARAKGFVPIACAAAARADGQRHENPRSPNQVRVIVGYSGKLSHCSAAPEALSL